MRQRDSDSKTSARIEGSGKGRRPGRARAGRSGKVGDATCRERYQNLIEQSSDGVFVADEAGRCLAVNAAGARMLGLPERQILRHPLLDRVAAVDPRKLAAIWRALRRGRTIRATKLYRRKGKTFPGVWSARMLSDGTVQAILRDLTARRRVERTAQAATARLRAIFDNSPIGVFLVRVTPSGRFVSEMMNPLVEQASGRKDRAVRGKETSQVFPAPLAAHIEAQFQQCLDTGAPCEHEISVRPNRVEQVFLHPIRNKRGRIHRIAGFVLDITKRKRAETALRDSEDKFARIFRVSPDAIVVTERDTGRIREANDSFLHLFRLSSAQARGRPVTELGFWPDAAARGRFVAELRARGAVRNFEMHWRMHGRERIQLLNAEPLEMHGLPCILSVVSDVTVQRRVEQERMEVAARERRAQESFTRQLIQSQEAERRRIAGELHDSLGQDLLLVKNRMHLALGGRPLDPELQAQLQSVETLATQAIAEVRRISHALHPPQLDHLGLTRALRAMLDAVGRTATFRLEQRLDDIDRVFPPEAEVSWYRIVQEALNNILKHARARNVEVVLERDVHVVRLIIADDGCGFAVAAAGAGGLGLRNLAERARILGGRLRVDSAPGTGTRLEAEVPLPAGV